MAKFRLPPGIAEVLKKIKKEVEEKQKAIGELETAVDLDKMRAELEATNEAIEREIETNTQYLAKLNKSIKVVEVREKKVVNEEQGKVQGERDKGRVESDNMKEGMAKKKKWRDEKIAECEEDVKKKEVWAKYRMADIVEDIDKIEKRHANVKNAFEETKRLAGV